MVLTAGAGGGKYGGEGGGKRGFSRNNLLPFSRLGNRGKGRSWGGEEGWKYVGRQGEVRGCFEGGQHLSRFRRRGNWNCVGEKNFYDKRGFKRNRLQHPSLFSGFDVFSATTALRLCEEAEINSPTKTRRETSTRKIYASSVFRALLEIL